MAGRAQVIDPPYGSQSQESCVDAVSLAMHIAELADNADCARLCRIGHQ